MGDGGQDAWVREADLEDLALIHQIAEPIGAGFLVNFPARCIAFLCEQLVEPGSDCRELLLSQDARQWQKTVAIERIALRLCQGIVAHAERLQRRLDVHGSTLQQQNRRNPQYLTSGCSMASAWIGGRTVKLSRAPAKITAIDRDSVSQNFCDLDRTGRGVGRSGCWSAAWQCA